MFSILFLTLLSVINLINGDNAIITCVDGSPSVGPCFSNACPYDLTCTDMTSTGEQRCCPTSSLPDGEISSIAPTTLPDTSTPAVGESSSATDASLAPSAVTTAKSTTVSTNNNLNNCTDVVKNCAQIAYLCSKPAYRSLMSIKCPLTCRFCVASPPSSTGCTDRTTNCSQVTQLCTLPLYQPLMTQQCAKTCQLCSSSTVSCMDANVLCSQWQLNGHFCTSKFYTTDQKRLYCAKTCNLC